MNIILAEVMAWPEAVVCCVGIICLVSWWMGRWPWQRDIYYDCDNRGCERDDEDNDEDETK